MKKSPVKVIVRLRPTANFAHKQMTVDEQSGQINIHVQRPLEAGIVNHQQNQWGFQFEKVLVNASQQLVYSLTSKEILTSALEGYSGCILCYGQTGAGKTFSITGAQNDYKYRGIVPRILSSLYQQINTRYDHQIKVSISYLQLYNESLIDLLNQSNSAQLNIQQDQKGYVLVKGLTKRGADNEEEALQILFQGENNKTVAEHKLNKNSSRAHAIFTVHLEIRSRVESSQKVVMSKINLVDLAGSERVKKTGSQGQTLIEAQNINRSLSYLEQVVVALSDQQRDHIPYRQAKLTYLLKDSIGGNSKTCMIANIWPQASHLQETISTLKFATRMTKVTNQISIDVNLDPKLLLKKYQRDIRELKQELAMHDTLANRGRINYQPYTPQQQHKQQVIAQQYLEGKIEDIQIESLRQVRELFLQFRNIYKAAVRDIDNNAFKKPEQRQEEKKIEEGQKKSAANRVGQEEQNFGFGAGKAARDSKPTRNISNLVNIPRDQFEEESENVAPSAKKELKPQRKIVNVDKNEAYQQFKSNAGQELNSSILKNIEEVKSKQEDAKLKAQEIQKKKEYLETINSKLHQKEESKTKEELMKNIIDEEEFQLIKEKKQCKRDYKLEIEKYKMVKNQIIELDKNITSLKTALLQKFEEWFFKRYGISVADLENPLLNQNDAEDEGEENEAPSVSEDIDEDALAYIHAKKKVFQIQKAKRSRM